jgi:hypothetical protein
MPVGLQGGEGIVGMFSLSFFLQSAREEKKKGETGTTPVNVSTMV